MRYQEESLENNYLSLEDSISVLERYESKVEWLQKLLLSDDERFIFEKKIPKQATEKEIRAYLGISSYRVKKLMKSIEGRFRSFRKFLDCLPQKGGAGRQSGRDRPR